MTYAVQLPPGGPTDWSGWQADLTARIRRLGKAEDVIVDVPALSRPHLTRKARMSGLIPAQYTDTSPWVRVRRDEDHAVAELVGSESFGGDFLLSPEEEARLDGLGWRRPGSDLILERIWTRWFPDDVTHTAYLSKDDAAAAAELVIRTLREVLATG
ncbi:TY-Chap domain-containing protein [Knoellia sp. CPCC 206435]|uniref:TY-Chap domain-containing protein n=1 Tax=Knoellia terrae TaxID=3404797 RepID=UPI003B43C86A